MVSCFALGKINRQLKQFTKGNLTDKGVRLLKGFYTANKWELEGSDSDNEAGDFAANINLGRVKGLLNNFDTKKAISAMNKYATDAKKDKAKRGGAIHPHVEEMKTLVELDPQTFDASPKNSFVNKDKDATALDVTAIGAILAASNQEEQKDSNAK